MKRSILAVCVISLALAGCNTSYNYFEDDDEGKPDTGPFNLAHSLLQHSGVAAKPRQRLAYKPRAPLAMPASSELPAPQEEGASAAHTAVNFPVDQSVQDEDRKQRLSALLNGNSDTSGLRDSVSGQTSSSGLVRLPAEAAGQRQAPRHNDDRFRDKTGVERLNAMGKKLNFRTPQQTLLSEDGKPAPRKYLIQPPEEYRTPAATAALPDESDIENSEWIDKQLYRGVKESSHKPYTQNGF
ncbi:MAG: hypothetical protein AAGB11_16055 [Pseudomonadota bacterium]